MKSRQRAACAFTCLLAILGFSAASSAQNLPPGEFAAGWRLLHVPDALNNFESQTLPLGWFADVAGNLNRVIAVVGEVAGGYKSYEETTTQFGVRIDVEADIDVYTFLDGLRFSARQQRSFVPYAQVLFGVARGSVSIEGQATVGGRTTTISESDSSSDFALDAGGGVTLNVADDFGVRVGASYLRVGGDDGGNAFRFGVGVVIPF